MGEAKRKPDLLRPGMPVLPPSMRHLPIDHRGFPVPWFVAWFNEAKTRELDIGEGTPDFRIIGTGRIRECIQRGRCWVCGNVITSLPAACVIGPMCSINRVSAEPPSHLACARFSAVACPFLSQPKMRRNDKGLDVLEETVGTVVPGIMIERNPGVTLVWITEQVSYNVHSRLFNVGEPIDVEWYAHGRRATRAEVMEAIESGLPALREVCDNAEAHAELDKRAAAITELLPPG